MRSLGRPEADLLILSAREDRDAALGERMMDCLLRCSDVDYFVRLCTYHRVELLASSSLADCLGATPPFVGQALARLGEFEKFWDSHRRRIENTISTIRKILSANGIPFAFERGIPYAQRYYVKPDLRSCLDVDLFVREGDGERVVQILLDEGFELDTCELVHRVHTTYVGKAELKHTGQAAVDLYWKPLGSVAIGPVAMDVTEIWRRAKVLQGTEYLLADEDVLLSHIRHAGYIHHFDMPILQCCADVAAMLRCREEEMDWAYVAETALRQECSRVMLFFAHFFDSYYRDDTMPALMPNLEVLRATATKTECRLFCRCVILPHALGKLTRKRRLAVWGFIAGNTYAVSMFWSLDRFVRVVSLLRRFLGPSENDVVLLTPDMGTSSIFKRRIRCYFNPLLLVLPGVVLGTVARVLSQFVRSPRNTCVVASSPPNPQRIAGKAEKDTSDI